MGQLLPKGVWLISPELNILHFSCAYPLSFYTTLMCDWPVHFGMHVKRVNSAQSWMIHTHDSEMLCF